MSLDYAKPGDASGIAAEAPRVEGEQAAQTAWRRLLLSPFCLFLAMGVVLWLRCPDALRFPELAYEDGNQLLGGFFNAAHPSSIFKFYNGYAVITTNAVAWLATRAPIVWAPHIFTLTSIAIAAFGFFLVSRPRFGWLIPNATDRVLVAFLLVLLPLGKSYVVYNLAYSLWSCLFVLIMLVSGPLPRSPRALALCSVGIVLGILSHPLSLIVLPILFLQLILDKRLPQRICVCLFIVTIAAYQIFGVEHGKAVHASIQSVHLSIKLFLSRVVFETVSGAMAGTTLIPENAQFVHYAAISILLVLAALTLTNRLPLLSKAGVLIAIGLAFGIIFASTAARLATGPDFPHLFKFYLQRYFYVPKLIIAILILAEVVRRFRLARASLHVTAQAALLLAFAVYLTGLNRANNQLYRNVHEDGVRIAEFLSTVQQQVQLARRGQRYTAEWRLPRMEPVWDIRLNVDDHLGRSDAAKLIEGPK